MRLDFIPTALTLTRGAKVGQIKIQSSMRERSLAQGTPIISLLTTRALVDWGALCPIAWRYSSSEDPCANPSEVFAPLSPHSAHFDAVLCAKIAGLLDFASGPRGSSKNLC